MMVLPRVLQKASKKVVQKDNNCIRGMVNKIPHLIEYKLLNKQWCKMSTEQKNLSNLSPAKGSNKKKKRKGRGPGSGNGKTAGKGHKGQKARAGGGIAPGFEGGQMPFAQRIPKLKGFNNPFRVTNSHTMINLLYPYFVETIISVQIYWI